MSRIQRLADADVVACHMLVKVNLTRSTVAEAQRALREYRDACEQYRRHFHHIMRVAADQYGAALEHANANFLQPGSAWTPIVFESHCKSLRHNFENAQVRFAGEYVGNVRRLAAATINTNRDHPLPLGV